MYVYVQISMYTYEHIYIYICTYTHVYIIKQISLHYITSQNITLICVYIYTHNYTYVYIFTSTCACTYIRYPGHKMVQNIPPCRDRPRAFLSMFFDFGENSAENQ